jgi:hypothetical protein
MMARRCLFALLAFVVLVAPLPVPLSHASEGGPFDVVVPWPEVGLVRADAERGNVYVYFAARPETLPERLHIAMTGLAHAGRIFEVDHCCLMPWNKSEARFHDTDEYYDFTYETWRLQLTWPGPPPEDIGWLGVVLPGREPVALAKGWVGIDLEDDGVTEILFLCHRPGESYLDLYLGQLGAEKQTWHGSVDLYQNLGFWNCGKWKS